MAADPVTPAVVEAPYGIAPARAYPPEAILTAGECAAWLRVSPRKFEELGVPHAALGARTRVYLARSVLAWLEKRIGRAA